MKKYIIILLFIVFKTGNAQDIGQLMQGYDNLYALEHIELFTKPQNEVHFDENYGLVLPDAHRSLRIVGVDASWLQSITSLIVQNPTILYPYLDSDTQNLAAYVLILHSLDLDMPEQNKAPETIGLNFLKKYIFDPSELSKFKAYKNTPAGENPAKFVLNTVWKYDVNEGANTRLKAIIEQ